MCKALCQAPANLRKDGTLAGQNRESLVFSERGQLLLGCCRRTTARKTPAISTRKCSCQKLANCCPALGQLLASRILYALLVGEKQYEIARARFCTQSCSKVGQLLVNSSPTPHPIGTCRGLPCSSPLATPDLQRLAGHSAVPCGTNTTSTNANRTIRIATQRPQGLRGPHSVFLAGKSTLWTNTGQD